MSLMINKPQARLRPAWWYSLILLCSLAALTAHAAEPESRPASDAPVSVTAPAIQVDQPIHDFGTSWAGPSLQHTFTITNTGKAALEISRVAPACGCTTVGEYPKELEPGKSGQFAFTLDSRKLHGVYAKTISIYSNDPATPELKLTLRGECKHYIELSPPSGAAFGKINAIESTERTVSFRNNVETPLKLVLQPLEASKFKYELSEIEPGRLFELRVSTILPYATGMLREKVTLTTNIDAQKTVTVDVVAVVPEPYEVIPNVINIAPPSASTPKTDMARTLTFTNNHQRPVKILETLVDDPAIKLAVEEQAPGKKYNVSVLIPASYSLPASGRTIVLRIDDPEKPFLLVPIKSTTAPNPPATQPVRKPDLVGKPAPDFTLTTVNGVGISKSALSGKITVLNFFAPNCGFCKKQLPRLETLRPAYEAKGVEFLLVSETMGQKVYSEDEIKTLLDGLKVEANWAMDSGNSIGQLFQANSYPIMVIVGKSGKIEAVIKGNSADLETRVKTQLDQLLSQADASSR